MFSNHSSEYVPSHILAISELYETEGAAIRLLISRTSLFELASVRCNLYLDLFYEEYEKR